MRFAIPALAAILATVSATPAMALTFVNAITVSGSANDLSGLGTGANASRLGGFGSDLIYDRASDQYFGISDRGPGGGLIDFAPRLQRFSLDINRTTGAVGGFTLTATTVLKDAGGTAFTGLNPLLANGSVTTLGRSLDSEGLARLPNGNFLVSDEYGPAVIEVDVSGQLVRRFTTPESLVPKTAAGGADYLNGRPTIVTGRQDNRGFEGITISNDGKTAYAVLQDPLVNEGAQNDGRRSRNVRVVAFDVATGSSTGQYVYQLESLATVNANLPGNQQFAATNQGRSIGLSAIQVLPDGRLLVLERDNRGHGVDDPTGANAVGLKGLFVISLAGATDVSGISLAGSNSLPAGVTPVSKTPYLDIRAQLLAAGITIGEKIEGVAFGPRLKDGGVSLILITDNDFSVTQTGNGTQLDVCTSGIGGISSQVAIDAVCPAGQSLIPTYVYSFRLNAAEAATIGFGAVPEPESWALLLAGFGCAGLGLRAGRPKRSRAA
jgi:hypothetical protein